MIGNGVRYVENVRSSIEAFFTAPVGTRINIGIDVALDSEPGRDFLFCLSRAAAMLKTFSSAPRALTTPQGHSTESLEGTCCQWNLSLHHKVPKQFLCFYQVYFR
ncbi:hypothetical protein BASA61_007167 [Batrachochytrium salamandrivorans]|nr:hypothetical protein BASA61_007167 [Batrachochytrium salamandrivorans]